MDLALRVEVEIGGQLTILLFERKETMYVGGVLLSTLAMGMWTRPRE